MTRKLSHRLTARRSRTLSRRLVLEHLERRDQPSFITAPAYPAGPSPDAIAAGRFDGDGIPDLAVANTSGTITILKGNGDASFSSLTTVPAVGTALTDLVAAELTGDAIVDLAVANDSGGNNLRVLKGNGDGTFAAFGSYTAGNRTFAVVTADFDLDGDLDLATANFSSQDVSVLLNNGAGSFSSAGNLSMGQSARDLAAGDFNNDGIPDLVCVGEFFTKVLLSQGDGTFVIAGSYNEGDRFVAAGDFNGDGAIDVVAGENPLLDVWLGNGDGTLAFSDSYPAGENPQSVVTTDLDGDGRLDLAIPTFGSGEVSVLRGLGDGRFQPAPGSLATGTGAREVVAADLDGDADIDLAVTNFYSGTVSVFRNAGGGNFKPAIGSYPVGSYASHAQDVASADFNDDGTPDLAISVGPGNNKLIVVQVNPDGSMGSATIFTVGASPGGLVAADFNGDGFPDLATANNGSSTVSVLINRGDGTFFPVRTFAAGPSPNDIGAADFNGDGRLDIVVTNNLPNSSLSFLRGTGTGRFRAPVSFDAGFYPTVLTIGDYDSDGNNDVAVVGCPFECDDVRVLQGNGNGSFGSPDVYLVGDGPGDVETADVNGDGIIDLVVEASGVSVLLGNGDGTFSAHYISNPGLSGVEVADFNRDGALDLAVTWHQAPLKIMLGNGDGTFQAPLSYTTGVNSAAAVVADFNGDDWPDIAMSRLYAGTVALALNAADWAPMPIGDGPRRSHSATAIHFAPINDRYASDLPRSGFIAQPRVAQRTLGELPEEAATLKGLDRGPQMQPFQGNSTLTTDYPGCAARAWAVGSNPFGVEEELQ